ncbi:DUF192 domain-containing protein [Chitinimonas viridis]|uniref:DUF192 domain-containing protein n=1 Tax=Chitinimonas viridis TaxID=664880 RepID=A0ABT8BBQ8_9NEIS|nr:DUF192 domain-containing protein [Chitinimonas viridis]MDN3578968.1 DUF192 domain-containing protein [Chitinimonas viridis]
MKQLAAWRGDTLLLGKVWLAESATERMQGLLGRPPLAADEAMLIQPCRLIHTVGMAYPLDLAFVDKQGRVRKLVSQLRPARMAGCLSATATLEMAPGTIARVGLVAGEQLHWRPA